MADPVEIIAEALWEEWRKSDLALASCKDLSWRDLVALDAGPCQSAATNLIALGRAEARAAIAALHAAGLVIVPEEPTLSPVEELRAACERAGSQKRWAQINGVSDAYVCDVLSGRREPGDAILNGLGLERVVSYRRRVMLAARPGGTSDG